LSSMLLHRIIWAHPCHPAFERLHDRRRWNSLGSNGGGDPDCAIAIVPRDCVIVLGENLKKPEE
jgi:hypothetical protein